MYFDNFVGVGEIYKIDCDKGFQDKLQIENELHKDCNLPGVEIVGDVVAVVDVVYWQVCQDVVENDSCHKHLAVGNIEVDIVGAVDVVAGVVDVAVVVDEQEMRRFEYFVYFG